MAATLLTWSVAYHDEQVERSVGVADPAMVKVGEAGRPEQVHDVVDGAQPETVGGERDAAHHLRVPNADHEAASGTQHAGHLGEGARDVVDEVDGVRGHGGVEGGVSERQ